MENISQFDLNRALQLWLARLGQSPQVKAENLTELESHVRDSVLQLQTKGLSSEESFLVATHRVGSPEKLEPEFAKVNRSPWNMIIHGVILAFFSVGCWIPKSSSMNWNAKPRGRLKIVKSVWNWLSVIKTWD